MNLYDEKIIVAIEDAIQNMVEASGITADVFRLDGDRVIDALLQALGDEYVIVPVQLSESIAEKLALGKVEKPRQENDVVWQEIADKAYSENLKIKKLEIKRDYKELVETAMSVK